MHRTAMTAGALACVAAATSGCASFYYECPNDPCEQTIELAITDAGGRALQDARGSVLVGSRSFWVDCASGYRTLEVACGPSGVLLRGVAVPEEIHADLEAADGTLRFSGAVRLAREESYPNGELCDERPCLKGRGAIHLAPAGQ